VCALACLHCAYLFLADDRCLLLKFAYVSAFLYFQPQLLLLIFSLVEFSMLTAAQARVAAAAQAGARFMSISGAPDISVQDRVSQILGADLSAACSISVQPAKYVGETCYVSVAVPMQSASPDLLWCIGFGLAGRTLESRAGMVAERCPVHTAAPEQGTPQGV